ncbi:MAG: glycosyltransferase family 2 protein [Cycloclasticus pugetii]|jgi:glycosyltransferase involved in cell wall biosynthesis|uniref:glycosyltransferase family 2 protein n=1 Tax=Cycloclasticus pugetii TaxID=34068 RepID=UPI003A9193BE
MTGNTLSCGQVVPVSVVIPCYNCTATIERAVSSVASQTYQPSEVILVNDCSNDDTLSSLFRIRGVYRPGWIKVLSFKENRGPGVARNIGWDYAKGDYIAFLDADDAWDFRKVEIQYGWMKRHKEVVLTGHRCCRKTGNVVVDNLSGPKRVAAVQQLFSNQFPTPSVMLKRDIRDRFRVKKWYAEDYLLWTQIVLNNSPCYLFEQPLVRLFKPEYGSGGLSKSLWEMEKGELHAYKVLFKQGRINKYIYFFVLIWSFSKFIRRLMIVYFRQKITVVRA